jgi:transcriptional regulator with XRE-family HTH domain
VPRTPNPTDVMVGTRIRKRRKDLNMSQSALGAALGVSFQQIQKYEKGVNRITASKLKMAATVLGVPTSYFLDKVEHANGGFADTDQSALDPETGDIARLVNAMERIADPDTRRSLIELAEKLALSSRRE